MLLFAAVRDTVLGDLFAVASAPSGHVEPVTRHAVLAGGQVASSLVPDVASVGDTEVQGARPVVAFVSTIGGSLGDDRLHLDAPSLAHPRKQQCAEVEDFRPSSKSPYPLSTPVRLICWRRSLIDPTTDKEMNSLDDIFVGHRDGHPNATTGNAAQISLPFEQASKPGNFGRGHVLNTHIPIVSHGGEF